MIILKSLKNILKNGANILKSKKYELLIISIGLLLLIILAYLLQLNAQSMVYLDSGSYYEAAENIYFFQRGHNLRPMLLAIIHGIPFLFGLNGMEIYESSIYLNVFFWLGTSLLIFRILKDYISEKKSFYLTLSTFLIFGNLVSNFHLLSENCYTFFVVLALYFIFKYRKNNKPLYFSLFISIITILMLIRPGAKFLALLFPLFFYKDVLKFYKKKVFIFVYFSWFLIFIQCAGIKYQFGNFTISYIDIVTYYNYLGTKSIALKNNNEFTEADNERSKYLFKLDYPEQKEEAKKDFIHQLKTNKYYLAKAYLDNLYENTFSGNLIIKELQNVKARFEFEKMIKKFYFFTIWTNLILVITCLILSVLFLSKYKNNFYEINVLCLYILYTFFTSGISSNQGDRFYLVFTPFSVLLIGYLIKKYFSKIHY